MKSFLKRMERALGGFLVRIGNYLIRHGEFRDPIYIQINSEIKIKYKSLKRHKGKHLKEAFAIADRMVANMDLDLDFYNDYYALKTIVDRYNIYMVPSLLSVCISITCSTVFDFANNSTHPQKDLIAGILIALLCCSTIYLCFLLLYSKTDSIVYPYILEKMEERIKTQVNQSKKQDNDGEYYGMDH